VNDVRPRRSLLFVPGLRPDRYPKALAAGADLVCVDIEDAVALPRKREARALTLPLFAEPAPADIETMMRINALSTVDGLRDLEALSESPHPPPAIMIPKTGSGEEIALIDKLLQGRCAHIRFYVIIESADGLANVHDIARASPRIDALLFGAVDISADLRCANTWETLYHARARVAHAAARFGLDLLDVPYLVLDDLAGLERAATQARELGFTGKAAIHPKQIPVINRVFSPAAAEIERARRILAEFDKNPDGLVVIDGALIEKPVVRAMQRTLAIAARIGAA
jgi:citrate lyase beta subunit